jgi:hypothetical protein
MNTKAIASAALLLLCLLTIGCGPSHRVVPAVEAGFPLHLEVHIPEKQLADARGTVYYSLPANVGAYVPKTLELRGNDLFVTLDTRQLVSGDRVRYYFDIFAGGKATSIGSAQRPFITDILDREGLILASIDAGVKVGKQGEPVTFFLSTGGFKASNPIVRYSPPDLPGIVEQAMIWKNKEWIAEVPGQRVAPGSWSYRIEANVQDIIYANPAEPGAMLYFNVPARK